MAKTKAGKLTTTRGSRDLYFYSTKGLKPNSPNYLRTFAPADLGKAEADKNLEPIPQKEVNGFLAGDNGLKVEYNPITDDFDVVPTTKATESTEEKTEQYEVETLEVSERIKETLIENGIYTTEELESRLDTLEEIDGIGAKSVEEIKTALA